MDRRTASAVVVLALAAIVVIAAWLLRADGAPTPVAAPPDPPLGVAAPRAAAASAPAVVSDPEVPATPAPASPAAAAATPAPSADRLVTPEEKVLRKWGPKGRVVEDGTDKPLNWWIAWIQVRCRDDPAALETRTVWRGTPTEDPTEESSAFDLAEAVLLTGQAGLGEVEPASLEYRVGARVVGHRGGRTEWRPLLAGPQSGEVRIDLEPERSGALLATVRNDDGSPFRGPVQPRFTEDGIEFPAGAGGDTDSAGRVRLALPSGDFEFCLAWLSTGDSTWHAAEVRTQPQRIGVREDKIEEAEFRFPAINEVRIKCIGPTGEALTAYAAYVESRGGRHGVPVDRIVGLPAGPAALTLKVDGYRTWKSTVDVVAGQVTKVEARFEKGEDPK